MSNYLFVYLDFFVSDIAIFVLKRDVKLQLTHLDLFSIVTPMKLVLPTENVWDL